MRTVMMRMIVESGFVLVKCFVDIEYFCGGSLWNALCFVVQIESKRANEIVQTFFRNMANNFAVEPWNQINDYETNNRNTEKDFGRLYH